jgi:hypothetical protein
MKDNKPNLTLGKPKEDTFAVSIVDRHLANVVHRNYLDPHFPLIKSHADPLGSVPACITRIDNDRSVFDPRGFDEFAVVWRGINMTIRDALRSRGVF